MPPAHFMCWGIKSYDQSYSFGQLPKSKKGHNSVKMNFRVMAHGHNIALMMVNKCVKFFRDKKVIGKDKVSTGQKQYAPGLRVTLFFVLKTAVRDSYR